MDQKINSGLEFSKVIGNIYTGSLYLSLASLLFHKSQEEITGKKILMYSYGSGVATTLFTLKVNKNFNKDLCIDPIFI